MSFLRARLAECRKITSSSGDVCGQLHAAVDVISLLAATSPAVQHNMPTKDVILQGRLVSVMFSPIIDSPH